MSTKYPVLNRLRFVAASADLANSTVTLANIADLSVVLLTNVTYRFKYQIPYTSTGTATGARFVMTGPTLAYLRAKMTRTLTATTETIDLITAYNVPAAANATSAGTGHNVCTIEGVIRVTATSALLVQFASETAGQAITVKAGASAEFLPLFD